MTSALVLGILVAFVVTTLAAAWRLAPTHASCPRCGGATTAVQPESWLLRRLPDVRARWCQACAWQGWGRHGAEWVPGHPAAHDSGFYWGEDRLPEDFGFRFADRPPTEAPVEPPDHPSGFRFNTSRDDSESEPRPGFRWASPGSAGAARHAWERREGRQEPPAEGSSRADAV
jgi:hypothetical protein